MRYDTQQMMIDAALENLRAVENSMIGSTQADMAKIVDALAKFSDAELSTKLTDIRAQRSTRSESL